MSKKYKEYYVLNQYGYAILKEDGYHVEIDNDLIHGHWIAPVEGFDLWYQTRYRFKDCLPSGEWEEIWSSGLLL